MKNSLVAPGAEVVIGSGTVEYWKHSILVEGLKLSRILALVLGIKLESTR